jgi:aminomethyltransferase
VRTPHGEGVVTSGTFSPCLEAGIGMAYLPAAAAEPGSSIEVDVRGKPRSAEVRKKPLYDPAVAGERKE